MSLPKEEIYNPFRNFKYQIIGGKIVSMAPLADQDHGIVSFGLGYIFKNYLKRKNCKKCRVYHDNAYLRLDVISKEKNIKFPDECKNDKFIPDVMIICDKSIGTSKGVIGTPELIVEVLSPRTEEYDITLKMQVYALIGVKEYWIVDYKKKSVAIYDLKDGNYSLRKIYRKYSQVELEGIEEERRDIGSSIEIITEFSPTVFPDLVIQIDDVFDDLIEE